jgi:hypothetical protein
MITYYRFAGFLAGILTITASSSYADTFDYSAINFGAGVTVTGSFVGTANGNVITDVSDASVFINGTSLGPITVESLKSGSFIDGGAEVSLDANQNNFFFAAAGFDGNSQDSFYSLTDPALDFNNPFFRYTDAGVNGSRSYWPPEFFQWSVTDTGPSSVPDATSTLGILGIGVAAIAFLRRSLSARHLQLRSYLRRFATAVGC